MGLPSITSGQLRSVLRAALNAVGITVVVVLIFGGMYGVLEIWQFFTTTPRTFQLCERDARSGQFFTTVCGFTSIDTFEYQILEPGTDERPLSSESVTLRCRESAPGVTPSTWVKEVWAQIEGGLYCPVPNELTPESAPRRPAAAG